MKRPSAVLAPARAPRNDPSTARSPSGRAAARARGARAGMPLFMSASPERSRADLRGRVSAASGGGAALDASVREPLERGLGADLSAIRMHADGEAHRLADALGANAFTSGRDIFLGAGARAPSSREGLGLLAHEAAHAVQQAQGPTPGNVTAGGLSISAPSDPLEQEAGRVAAWVEGGAAGPPPAWSGRGGRVSAAGVPAGGALSVQREEKKKKDGSSSAEPGTATGEVGVAGGESDTPSDQDQLAAGYGERGDGQYSTPDGRVVSKEQAQAESRVLSSAGIFMGAYLARYEAVKKYSLSAADLDRLSANAGFMKQFQTGDVVLRLMDASDSANLAKITESHYSHSGIIQVKGGRVWVLDSYPGRKFGATADGVGVGEDSTQLTRFEDFFSDHGKEKIVNGIVLRMTGMTAAVRAKVDELITSYDQQATSFDYDFQVDNDKATLYCSELVYRILVEAGSATLPPNEFEKTLGHARDLVGMLKAAIELQKSQKADTTASEAQLAELERVIKRFEGATAQELYSPGSLERTPELEGVAGFTREGEIHGSFKVIALSAKVPDATLDTPDPYVSVSGGLLGASGKTSVKSDTTTPTWNETLITVEYSSLKGVELQLYDEDTLSDDLLATFTGDLRPARPSGQTFTLQSSGATLVVLVQSEDGKKSEVQAPRDG